MVRRRLAYSSQPYSGCCLKAAARTGSKRPCSASSIAERIAGRCASRDWARAETGPHNAAANSRRDVRRIMRGTIPNADESPFQRRVEPRHVVSVRCPVALQIGIARRPAFCAPARRVRCGCSFVRLKSASRFAPYPHPNPSPGGRGAWLFPSPIGTMAPFCGGRCHAGRDEGTGEASDRQIARALRAVPSPQPLSRWERGLAFPFSHWEKVPRRGG